MKLAVVVQRYGQAINGGAELHARYIAEHLARHAEVEVLTTCATRLRHLAQRAPAGRRAGQRRPGAPVPGASTSAIRCVFGRRSAPRLRAAPLARRRARLARRGGPDQPGAGRLHRASTPPTTTTACSSATATTTRTTARAPPRREAILVPTAERDAAIGLSIFQPMFRGVRALMYNSPEERAMIQAVVRQRRRPRRRRRHRIGRAGQPAGRPFPAEVQHPRPFAVYVGRIDENKGCERAVRVLPAATCSDSRGKLSLVLIGNSLLPIPDHPRIRHLGFLDDARQVRRDGGRRAADHAVVLREPVDGRARSVGARPAGARQRPVRRAEGPVHPQQRRPVLRDATASSSRRSSAIEQNRWLSGVARAQRPAVLPRALRLAGHRAEVSRHVRAAAAGAPADRQRRWSRCPAGSRRRR